MSAYRKNVASQYVTFALVNASSGAVITGATIGSIGKFRTIDGAAQASMTGTVTETANGQYQMALSQADTNGNDIAWLFTYSGALPVNYNVVTTAGDPTDAVRGGLTALPNAAASAVGGLPVAVDTSGRVDVLKVNGTSQTARDIGASVLISAGSGAGQLDVTSGVIKSNLAQILGTALTETAGQLAAAFKQFFNIGGPTSTMNLITGVTTTTNLTNAATAGDLTAAMKTSVTTAASSSTPTVTLANSAHGGAAATLTLGGAGGLTATHTGNTTGSVGSVTGAVGSVTGAVGSVTGAVGSVAAAVSITGDLSATMKTSVENSVWNAATASHQTAGTTGLALTGATAPTAAAVADAVWDEAISGHLTGGSTGASLNGAGAAGDPWTASLPGAYGAGTAGAKIGALTFTVPNRVDATPPAGSGNTYTQQGSGDSPLIGR